VFTSAVRATECLCEGGDRAAAVRCEENRKLCPLPPDKSLSSTLVVPRQKQPRMYLHNIRRVVIHYIYIHFFFFRLSFVTRTAVVVPRRFIRYIIKPYLLPLVPVSYQECCRTIIIPRAETTGMFVYIFRVSRTNHTTPAVVLLQYPLAYYDGVQTVRRRSTNTHTPTLAHTV